MCNNLPVHFVKLAKHPLTGVPPRFRRSMQLAARAVANANRGGGFNSSSASSALAASGSGDVTDVDTLEAACRCWLCERWVIVEFTFVPGLSGVINKFDPVRLLA